MAGKPKYKRVLVKVSGEALSGDGAGGIDRAAMDLLVGELHSITKLGVQVGLVVGGGNILRGRDLADNPHIRRVTADFMGMTATLINALALQDTLEAAGIDARVLSAIELKSVCEPFATRRAVDHLEKGRLVILAGGTGSPFFTTDTCAALRALEIGAEVFFKATKVDGVFEADPVKCPDAKKYETLSYQKVLADRLGVMDLTAISLCMESDIPIVVFQLSKSGNLAAAVRGEPIGTTIGK